MKNLIQILLVVVTIASLAYGYYQSTERSQAVELAEHATTLAEKAEMEAITQRDRAEESRVQAQVAMAVGREHQAQAEKALAECQQRRR